MSEMLDKAKQMCHLIELMDKAGFNFTNETKQDFDDVYVAIMWENRFPPQNYEAISDGWETYKHIKEQWAKSINKD